MIRRLALFLPVLCAALAPAQDKPAPNKPVDLLAPFRPMLGTWTGEGTVRFDPNAEPTGWTARATFQLCLGGQFVQEDIELRFAALPTPLAIRGSGPAAADPVDGSAAAIEGPGADDRWR
jgi:hypothetical protein